MALSSSSSVRPSRKLHHLGAGPSDGTKNACNTNASYIRTTERFHPEICVILKSCEGWLGEGARTREIQVIMCKQNTIMAGVSACAAG